MPKDKYKFIPDKISTRLCLWKSKSLSLAGLVTLTTSVLSSIHIFTIFVPRSVYDSIDKMIQGFVWGSTSNDATYTFSLGKLSLSPRLRALSHAQINIVLLAKLGWRTLQNLDSLWSRVIQSKYFNGWLDRDGRTLIAHLGL
ncbi:LOW QUALITY PROTEIN: hypothetical protein V2J09_022622 [Rumex salicifolius]